MTLGDQGSIADVWHQKYMNDEDADETTRLMSDELPSRGYEEDEASRDQRHRRPAENEGNIYKVGPPQTARI